MQDQAVPSFNNEDLALIVKRLYGFEGEIKPLVSYEDQNARLTVGQEQYVLKISNRAVDIASLDFQNSALEWLERELADSGLPMVLNNCDGGTIAVHEGHAVRLLTFVPGRVYADVEKTQELYESFGSYMGHFSKALQGFKHPQAYRDDFIWGLDNVMMVKPYKHHIADESNRARVERFFNHYEDNIMLKTKGLRKAVIHQDANDYNMLVNDDGIVAGIIDFGDMAWGSQVNELAIMLAYAMQNTDNISDIAKAIITSYNKVFPLEPIERELVMDLAAMRVVQSVTLSSRDAIDDPNNEYLVISQTPGFKLLENLEYLIL